MKKQIIRLTENDLQNIIKESVNNILMENNVFFDGIEKELHMPYECRKSQMTDEEILQLLQQHKEKEMAYSEQQLRAERERELNNMSRPLANDNIVDNNGNFSNSASYVRGDFKNVPM